MSSMNEYKDQLMEGVKGTVEGVQESLTNLIGSENLESAKGTMESVRETVSHIFSSETVEGVKETLAEEAAIVSGYKDRLVGEVKETVGHLMGNADMEKEGHKQKLRGEAELAQHRAMGEEAASREWQMNARFQMGRQALLAELGRMGGFERQKSRLRHVETQEKTLSDTLRLRQADFHLKRFDVKPLLAEIRGFEGRRSTLRHVEYKERGLLRSLPIDKKDFSLKEAHYKRLFADLNKDGALATLHKVPAAQIRDRSSPRLDLLRTTSQAISQSSIGALLKDIRKSDAGELKHVETTDKSSPSLAFDAQKPVKLDKVEKKRLLDEIKGGAELKHVNDVNDKSKPNIDKDVQIKTWDRQSFLDEVRQGTELKHI